MAKQRKQQQVTRPVIDLRKTVVLDKDGTRITPSRVKNIVKEVHQVLGRPSLTGSPVHSPEVKARVPHTLKRALQKEAERRGQTSSALLREALEQYLKGA